ncbi:hypothetical protein ABZ341_23990 [Streptomyces sp. NPDC006173]|uniref:hypothetical protein n=1 Tax=Streptomyces sp. NPDC006173 TaxID=3155349 RepID=UPI0033C397C1
MPSPTRKPQRPAGKKHPKTAGEEVLREVEKAETQDVDGHEQRGQDREASDALTPNQDAQNDVQPHHG